MARKDAAIDEGFDAQDDAEISTDDKGQTEAPGVMALVPVQEQIVDFYGDKIPVAQTPEGDLYVPLRPLTDFLGLAFTDTYIDC